MTVNKHKNYLEIFHHFIDITYDSVQKDQVMIFSASSMKPTSEILETIKRNFVKLCLDLMGPKIKNDLSIFFGEDEILIRNMLVQLQAKIDNDEILDFAKKVQKPEDEEISANKEAIANG